MHNFTRWTNDIKKSESMLSDENINEWNQKLTDNEQFNKQKKIIYNEELNLIKHERN